MDEELESAIGPSDLIPRLRNQGYDLLSVGKRRSWTEKRTGASLRHSGACSFDTAQMRGNIENVIGVTQVPLGVAGPILVRGEHADGLFYVPMATTEGALVRSYERGMTLLTHAGGVQTRIEKDENHIAPSFFFDDVRTAGEFVEWVEPKLEDLRRTVAATTRHGKLTSVRCMQIGPQVLLRLHFSTGDAQGMNMITRAADAVRAWIAEHSPLPTDSMIFSGLSSEKRASGLIMTEGKGKRVTAGALVSAKLLKTYLRVTPEQMFKVWSSTVRGHLQAGAIGFNAHIANGLTAMFLATGQDVANVVNASCGILSVEPRPEGIYISVTLPSLSIATVGGGVGLPTQREALEMMDCFGTGKAKKLAEIMAAAALGGELSFAAAIGSDEFSAAHERYGRNRPE